LKDINSANFTVKGFAEKRNQFSYPGNGCRYDQVGNGKGLMKSSKRKFKSKMLLQVHDELVFDALKEEVEDLKPVIIECMQIALPLPNGVPVVAEVGVGENWLEAH
jgi:DNA polymerase-1